MPANTHCRVAIDASIVCRTSPADRHVSDSTFVITDEHAIDTIDLLVRIPVAGADLRRLDVHRQERTINEANTMRKGGGGSDSGFDLLTVSGSGPSDPIILHSQQCRRNSTGPYHGGTL